MWRLDHVHTDVGESLDKLRTNFDDLEVNYDKVQVVLGRLLHGVDLKAKTERLLNNLWPSLVSWSELVVARENPGVVAVLFLLALHMLLVVFVVLPLVGNLWSDEDVGKWVGVGVQLEAIQHQPVGAIRSINGEVELEVAAVLLMVLGLSMVVLEHGRASGAVEAE